MHCASIAGSVLVVGTGSRVSISGVIDFLTVKREDFASDEVLQRLSSAGESQKIDLRPARRDLQHLLPTLQWEEPSQTCTASSLTSTLTTPSFYATVGTEFNIGFHLRVESYHLLPVLQWGEVN